VNRFDQMIHLQSEIASRQRELDPSNKTLVDRFARPGDLDEGNKDGQVAGGGVGDAGQPEGVKAVKKGTKRRRIGGGAEGKRARPDGERKEKRKPGPRKGWKKEGPVGVTAEEV
jgi:hypothetical protein